MKKKGEKVIVNIFGVDREAKIVNSLGRNLYIVSYRGFFKKYKTFASNKPVPMIVDKSRNKGFLTTIKSFLCNL